MTCSDLVGLRGKRDGGRKNDLMDHFGTRKDRGIVVVIFIYLIHNSCLRVWLYIFIFKTALYFIEKYNSSECSWPYCFSCRQSKFT